MMPGLFLLIFEGCRCCTVLIHPMFYVGLRIPAGHLVVLILRAIGEKTFS